MLLLPLLVAMTMLVVQQQQQQQVLTSAMTFGVYRPVAPFCRNIASD